MLGSWFRWVILGVLSCLLVWTPGVDCVLTLKHLDTIYMPTSYNPETFEYASESIEQMAFDPVEPYLYVVGRNVINILDISDVTDIERIKDVMFDINGDFTDVETCKDWVAVSFHDKDNPLKGKVFVFKRYNPVRQQLRLLHEIVVGSLPDMLKFTKDCRTIVVAIEGELTVIDGQAVDPEGGVGLIKFAINPDDILYQRKILDFQKFNDRAEEYVERGVRWVFRGEDAGIDNTFSQDLEPEYVAISPDDTMAYVVLQENNAMAIVSLVEETILELEPLGVVDWSSSRLDPSDSDGGIHINPWPVYGLKQPDSISYFEHNGQGYILTANEGADKEYEEPDFPFQWSEQQRGDKFDSDDLLLSDEIKEALQDDAKLGRLQMSIIDGRLDNGSYTKLYTYGGRGFSIYQTPDMNLVYNSQSEIEERMAELYPTIFNSDPGEADLTPEETMDTRSDNKGAGPESTEIGEINGHTVLFIGVERPGFVAIYLLPQQGQILPEFQSLHYAGGFGKPWEQLYEERIARDLNPEDIQFMSAEDSPTGRPMVGVLGTTTATVSLYEVEGGEELIPRPAFRKGHWRFHDFSRSSSFRNIKTPSRSSVHRPTAGSWRRTYKRTSYRRIVPDVRMKTNEVKKQTDVKKKSDDVRKKTSQKSNTVTEE